jgi:hypothetical protein
MPVLMVLNTANLSINDNEFWKTFQCVFTIPTPRLSCFLVLSNYITTYHQSLYMRIKDEIELDSKNDKLATVGTHEKRDTGWHETSWFVAQILLAKYGCFLCGFLLPENQHSSIRILARSRYSIFRSSVLEEDERSWVRKLTYCSPRRCKTYSFEHGGCAWDTSDIASIHASWAWRNRKHK